MDVVVVLKFAHKEHSGGIGLHLLHSDCGTAKGLFHTALAVDGLLDAKSMCNLTECGVPEERIR